MKLVLMLVLMSGCVAAPVAPRTPVPFSDHPAVSFEQARAICAPRAQAAATQAQAQSQAQLLTQPNVGGYQRAAVPAQAARQAGNNTYSGCLAEQGWSLR